MNTPDSADRDRERSDAACCEGPTYYPFVNDAAMDSVREQFTTADRMLCNVSYDGKQIKHELSLMFAELAMWRRTHHAVETPDQPGSEVEG